MFQSNESDFDYDEAAAAADDDDEEEIVNNSKISHLNATVKYVRQTRFDD